MHGIIQRPLQQHSRPAGQRSADNPGRQVPPPHPQTLRNPPIHRPLISTITTVLWSEVIPVSKAIYTFKTIVVKCPVGITVFLGLFHVFWALGSHVFWEEVGERLVSTGSLSEGGWSEVPSDDIVYYGVEYVVPQSQVLELEVNWKKRDRITLFLINWSWKNCWVYKFKDLFCNILNSVFST